jgi:exodeoxyribonuclease-3
VCALEFDRYWFVGVYTPNAQDGLKRIDVRLAWDARFRDFLKELEAEKPVICCGDLNVAHNEIDLKNPAANRGNAGFSDEERESFQKLLDAGFCDTFRYRHPDVTGAYSWWSYRFRARQNNAGWRIDYFLVSNALRDNITSASILSEVMGSDHCPVELTITL